MARSPSAQSQNISLHPGSKRAPSKHLRQANGRVGGQRQPLRLCATNFDPQVGNLFAQLLCSKRFASNCSATYSDVELFALPVERLIGRCGQPFVHPLSTPVVCHLRLNITRLHITFM